MEGGWLGQRKLGDVPQWVFSIQARGSNVIRITVARKAFATGTPRFAEHESRTRSNAGV